MTFPSRFTPNVLDPTVEAGSNVEVTSASGDTPASYPILITTDGYRTIISSDSFNYWIRLDRNDHSSYDYFIENPFFATNFFAFVNTAPGEIWGISNVKFGGDGILTRILSDDTNLTIPFGSPYDTGVALNFTDMAYDGTSLWIINNIGELRQINPAAPYPPVLTTTPALDGQLIRIDQDGTSYPFGIKRAFITAPGEGRLYKVRLDTGLADGYVDSLAPRGLAIGTGAYANKIFLLNGALGVKRYDGVTLTLEASVLMNFAQETSWIDYDSNTDKLWIMGLSAARIPSGSGAGNIANTNNGIALRLDPGTLVVEALVELSINAGTGKSAYNGGPGLLSTGHFQFYDSKVWICDPQTQSTFTSPFTAGRVRDLQEGDVYILTDNGSGEIAGQFDGVATQFSGATASITEKIGKEVVITGLSGMTPDIVGSRISIGGAQTPNISYGGPFLITEYVSATSIKYDNPYAIAPDSNNGSITWQINSRKFSSAASTFITSGVAPGDLLFTNTDEIFLEIESVISETELRVLTSYGADYSPGAIFFQIWRPLTKTSAFEAAPKEIGFADTSWRSFDTFYLSLGGSVTLGDGELTGRYRRANNMVEVEVSFYVGSYTTFADPLYLLPIPPDAVRIPSTSPGNFTDTAVVSTSAGPIAFPIIWVSPAFAVINAPLSALVAGNAAMLSYKIPVRRK